MLSSKTKQRAVADTHTHDGLALALFLSLLELFNLLPASEEIVELSELLLLPFLAEHALGLQLLVFLALDLGDELEGLLLLELEQPALLLLLLSEPLQVGQGAVLAGDGEQEGLFFGRKITSGRETCRLTYACTVARGSESSARRTCKTDRT